jgi:hypothetical protein
MEVTDNRQTQLFINSIVESEEIGGFNFDLYHRNKMLTEGVNAIGGLPGAWKTGTTIVGMIYKDGVVLGADTRATGGTEVVDKVIYFYLFFNYKTFEKKNLAFRN